jgi:hypothetical protein
MSLQEYVENIQQREGNEVEITQKRRWREEVEWEQHVTQNCSFPGSIPWKSYFPWLSLQHSQIDLNLYFPLNLFSPWCDISNDITELVFPTVWCMKSQCIILLPKEVAPSPWWGCTPTQAQWQSSLASYCLCGGWATWLTLTLVPSSLKEPSVFILKWLVCWPSLACTQVTWAQVQSWPASD